MAKAGRPRNKLPHDYQMVLPKDTLLNRAKRAYWLVRELEKAMSKDITAVDPIKYHKAVEVYADLCDELKKKGYKRNHARPEKRVDSQGSDQGSTERSGSQGIGENGSADMGSGVRAVNPIT